MTRQPHTTRDRMTEVRERGGVQVGDELAMPTQPPVGSQVLPLGGIHGRITFTRVDHRWRSPHADLTWPDLLASTRSAGLRVTHLPSGQHT